MLFTAALLLVPQAAIPDPAAAEPWFRIHHVPGDPPRVLVSANKYAVSAESALRQLAQQLAWKLSSESVAVDAKLGAVTIDLAFTKQPPRTVAHLIAASAGVDVAFHAGGERTELHLITAPTGESESGRARLRHWAIHWYQQFLADDPTLAQSPIVQEKGMQTLMHLGRLLLQGNDLEGAVKVYNRIFEQDDSQRYVPMALLRLTEAHFELAKAGGISEAKRKSHLERAEDSARRLTRLHPKLQASAQAAVLLGRILIADRRYSECIKALEANSLRLHNAPEIIDIYLLIAECYTHGELPDRVLHSLDLLASIRSYKEWSQRQWLDYHYLRAVGAEGMAAQSKDPEQRLAFLREGMQASEQFLGIGRADHRRAQGFVVLGRIYLGLGKYLEARAAAIEAMLDRKQLDVSWLQAARILEAKSKFALGERDEALTNLEVVIRPNPEQVPELVLFLVDALRDAGRFDRAISNAALLAKLDGRWGDEARLRQVRAMFEQATVSDSMRAFPAEAIEIARRVQDKDIQRDVAEIIGKAYEALNQIDKAADAYRGILR
ncbi:MAG: hypothetical protein KDC87_13030 [Planctomycetes bacterium]|nr:hypothetical protein [Planctomycetota bacterium]MCB9868994.1 hypothetical protein [Planctomycetota bacterium]MCB9887954.1 hypothetical protein [Planctomycetota bacterium]